MIIAITGCDERGGEKPRLTVNFERNKIYGEGVDCNINNSRVTFILEGNPSVIQDAKLLVEYDKLRGFFVGSGSSDYIVTENDGTAIGTYQAYPSAYGVTSFTVKVDRFREVKETVTIYLYDIPEIELTADEYTIPKNESTNIYVQLTDKAENIANIPIYFSATDGLVGTGVVRTDDSGKAENVFAGDDKTGKATVRAALGFCDKVFQEIEIIRQ